MDKKIKINAEVNKQRMTIPTDNGIIVVNNPSQKLRNELIDELQFDDVNEVIKELVTAIMKNTDFDEKVMMKKLIDDCTNVEFDKDVFEVEYLSHEAKMITNEILIIFQEIISEAYQVINLVLQQIKNEELQNGLLEEKNEIEQMVVEKENKIEDTKEIKEVKREIRKPQRRRKK